MGEGSVMSGTFRARSTRHTRHRWWRAFHRTVAVSAILFVVAELGAVALSAVRTSGATAAPAPPGQGFSVTPGDLHFILKQIQIAEHHAATQTPSNMCGTLVGPAADQIPDRLTSYGLRTVDGSCNNLFPDRERFASADQPFPRLSKPKFSPAEGAAAGFFGPGSPAIPSSSYAQKKGFVFDSQPRTVSNLIVDQTSTNPSAVHAAGFPVRSQTPAVDMPVLVPCTTDPVEANPTATPPVVAAAGVPTGCTPQHKTLFIPNVTTDVGLSPPYNSVFTFFGQFFDHGVDQTVKSGGTVFVPLKPDDPLITLGPDGKPNTGDEVKPGSQFMVLTRAQNQPGPDGVLGDQSPNPNSPVACTPTNKPNCDGSADDVQDANNTDSPWVDQSQTYTSHPSHQIFLREYDMTPAGRDGILADDPNTTVNEAADNGGPAETGALLGGLLADDPTTPGVDESNGATGMATWASVKKQAAEKLGLKLVDADVTNIPMLATDPYGNFLPGPHGLPQYALKGGGLLEGNLANPVPVPANVLHFDTPFLTDIAHNADPSPVDTNNDGIPDTTPVPDADNTPSADFAHQPTGTYDDEMLNAHFACGDGRCNENIALSTIHQIFHSEHNRLVGDIQNTLNANPTLAAAFDAPHLVNGVNVSWGHGGRLFQAARFVTEMEYQHLVFEEFARKVQPAVRPFHVYSTEINAAVEAEFAHAVYRFGHSMLDDDVARKNSDGTDNSLPLLTAFLNPPEYFNSHAATPYNAEEAAGAIVMGSSDQTGNELDEFVTETLRNNLLGLPLALPTINMPRARSEGIPPLNDVRRQIFAATNDGQLAPYTSWADFGQHLKHPESLINFVAAYGTHPSITSADGYLAKRAAATLLVDPPAGTPVGSIPTDAANFL